MAEKLKNGDEVVYCVDAMGNPTTFDAQHLDDPEVRFGKVVKLTANEAHVRPNGSHPKNAAIKVPLSEVRLAPAEAVVARETVTAGAGDAEITDELPALKFKRLSHGEGLPLPAYKSAGAAGLDICAATSLTVMPGERRKVPTGFAIEVPPGFECQVRPRSGLALEDGITVLNSPGTIDCDYRGEVFALLLNTSSTRFRVNVGDRIAQLVPKRVDRLEVLEVDELTETERGDQGYGSTGKA